VVVELCVPNGELVGDRITSVSTTKQNYSGQNLLSLRGHAWQNVYVGAKSHSACSSQWDTLADLLRLFCGFALLVRRPFLSSLTSYRRSFPSSFIFCFHTGFLRTPPN